MEIINKILDWPVLIQAVLGSFLFWALFTLGQNTLNFFSRKIKDEKELGSFFGREARDNFTRGNFERSTYNFFMCIYASIHYFLKFVLTVFLSFLLFDIVPTFAYVGYVFSIYFIFRALSYVTHFSTYEKEDKKEKEAKVSQVRLK